MEWEKNTDNLMIIALEKFSADNLPIIRVVETEDRSWMFVDDDAAPENETHIFDIDLKKLFAIVEWDSFRLNYVYNILEAALEGKTVRTSSKKYSFSDTPDWWTDITADDTTGRTVVEIEVELS